VIAAHPDTTLRSVVRRLAANVSFYTISLVTAGTLRLLAVPFVVRAVAPSVYGTFATLWTVMWIVTSASDLGLGTSSLRLAPECESESERRTLFGTMLSTRAAVGLFLSGLVVLVSEPLAHWLTGSPGNGPALAILALFRPISLVYDGLNDELRSRDAVGKVSGLIVLWAALVHGLTIVLVVFGGFQLLGLVWARILAEVITFGVALLLCFRFVRAAPRIEPLRRLLAFGWPIGAMYVLGSLRAFDRPLIRTLTSLDGVAAYELAMRLVGPIGLANISLAKVLEPVLYVGSRSRATPGHVDLFLRCYVVLFTILAMALAVFGPEGIRLFAPPAYYGAIRVLPALAFATACEGLGRVAGVGADLSKRTRVWAVVSALTLVIGLPLSALLVPRLGVTGAGLAWVVANIVAALLAYRVGLSLSAIVLPVKRSLLLIAVGAVLGTVAAWQPWPFVARFALLIAFGFSAWRVMGLRVQTLKALLVGGQRESVAREPADALQE
jgi:O-antigen/teichoic acid export membrane protein